MGSNASKVLDRILVGFQKEEGLDKGNAFEKFACQRILKDYSLASNQIDEGIVDGEGDGGIDGFFVLVNGVLYKAGCDYRWPPEDVRITVWIITCKNGDGFQEAPLVSMHATLSEFWDMGKTAKDFRGRYSEKLLRARAVFWEAYTTLACLDPFVDIHLVYASRGDAGKVAPEPKGRMKQLEEQAKTFFSKGETRGEFIGSRELLRYDRRTPNEDLVLPFSSLLNHEGNSFIAITKLKDYFEFIKDREGKLRRNLFASNVRAFLGYNSVNEDIDHTLRNPSGVHFWWLNNGITILANKARVMGRQLRLWGGQIVNGLQTTETLYRHFASGRTESLESEILIRVLTSQDAGVRNCIIQATNNQSSVASYSLHATDEVQRDIEVVLEGANYFYERLEKDPKNAGKPTRRCIKPIELAKSFLAIVYHNPAAAAKLQIKFTRNPLLYNAVFSRSFPVDRWALLAAVWRAAERVYNRKIGKRRIPARYCKRWMPLVVYCSVAKLAGKFDFTIKDLQHIEWSPQMDAAMEEIWQLLVPHFDEYPAVSRAKLAAPKAAYDAMLLLIAAHTGLNGVECANKRNLPTTRKEGELERPDDLGQDEVLSESVLQKIQNALPKQPWPVGAHRMVAERLGVRAALVHAGIEELITRGIFNRQKDGVVYDGNGIAIAVDAQRCNRSLQEINAEGPQLWE